MNDLFIIFQIFGEDARHGLVDGKKKPLSHSEVVLLRNHILKFFNISAKSCSSYKDASPFIIVIDRKTNRKILNIVELFSKLKRSGFANVSIVSFEKYTVQRQLSMAFCADLLVGVHGAGLHW